jgi:hypothetical protein
MNSSFVKLVLATVIMGARIYGTILCNVNASTGTERTLLLSQFMNLELLFESICKFKNFIYRNMATSAQKNPNTIPIKHMMLGINANLLNNICWCRLMNRGSISIEPAINAVRNICILDGKINQ